MNTADKITVLLHRVNQMRDTVTRCWKLLGEFERDGLTIAHSPVAKEEKPALVEQRRQRFHDELVKLLGVVDPCECHAKPAELVKPTPTAEVAAVQPQPGPWTLHSSTFLPEDGIELGVAKDATGSHVTGIMLIVNPFQRDVINANVALVLAAPTLLREAQLLIDYLEPTHGRFIPDEATHYSHQVEYVTARLHAMVAAATPIRVKGGA
jgi:hypothetical protein